MQRFKLFVALMAACWLGLVLTFAWPAIAGSFGGGAGARSTTAIQGTAAAIGDPWPVQLSDGTNAIGVGTGTEAAALRVTVATDSTGVLSVDDNSGSLTVDGTVAVSSIAAGDTNIGNVDVLTVPAPLNVVGTGTEAAALRVTIATDSTGVLSVDDNASSLTTDSPQLPATLTAGGALKAAIVEELPAGTQNIGDVDVLTVPAPLNVVGTGTEAAALRVTIATDSTGVLSVDDNAGSLTVDGTVAVSSIAAGTNNIGKVDVASLVSLPTGTNTIGSVVVKGSTGVTGGAPLADSETNLMSNCAVNGTTTVTPAAGTYEICAVTSETSTIIYLCYTDDSGSGTDCATKGEPFGASSTVPGCKIRRLANVAHYCRGNATADFIFTALTY